MKKENTEYQQRADSSEAEMEAMKQDLQQVIIYKNEIEQLMEEQTQIIENNNRKIFMIEEAMRFKDGEIEKKDSMVKRV